MGFYPVCPGSGEYVLGTPLFKHLRIKLENGNSIVIDAPDNSRDNRYIKAMRLNGKSVDVNYLTHDQLTGGAYIECDMDCKPCTTRGTSDASAPYSFTNELKKQEGK